MPERIDHIDEAAQAKARLLLLAAAVLWSTSGLFAKAPYFDIWPASDGYVPVRGLLLAFWRAVFASLLLLPAVRRPRWTWKLVPAALLFVAMNVTYLSAMVLTTAANAIWLQNTAPVWVFLFGALFLHDPIYRRDWMLLGFAMLGVGTILVFELQGSSPAGVLWGLGGGLTYSGVVLSLRWLRNEDSAWVVGINHVVTAAVLLPCIFIWSGIPSSPQLMLLIAFGMFQMGLPYLLFARALKSVPSHEAAGMVLLEPVLVPVWVFLAWGERPAVWTLCGGAFILLGLLLRYLRSKPALP